MNTPFVWPGPPLNLRTLVDHGARCFTEQQLYFGHGTDNAWDEALWLALHALDLSWSFTEEALQRELSPAQIDQVTQLFERRVQERLPAAYITGRALFAGLEFIVSPDVLVPRSPIAELIENQFQPWLLSEPQRILDLCTGSGCIGIACANVFPDAFVDCSDVSSAALSIAERNVQLHQMSERVRLIESDLFKALSGQYDLIVSNPPYVDANDLSTMPAEYRAEPVVGLAAGDDGLDFCRQILRQAPRFLNPRGCLIVEVGNSWPALEQAFPQVPFTWLEFNYGGDGVFVLTTEELQRYAALF